MDTKYYLIIGAVLLLLNINSFAQMAIDKKKAKTAKSGADRTPEKTLFFWTGMFGGLGGVLGMVLCRHKTQHWYFALFFPLMMIAQIAILVCIYIFFIA